VDTVRTVDFYKRREMSELSMRSVMFSRTVLHGVDSLVRIGLCTEEIRGSVFRDSFQTEAQLVRRTFAVWFSRFRSSGDIVDIGELLQVWTWPPVAGTQLQRDSKTQPF
jgi:hypothetical protein